MKIKFLTNKSFDMDLNENTTNHELYEKIKIEKELRNDFLLVTPMNTILQKNDERINTSLLLLVPKDLPYNQKDVDIILKK